MRSPTARAFGLAGALTLALAALAGCSSAATTAPATPAPATPAPATLTVGITVSGAWARNSTAMAAAGAAYMTIANAGSTPDALLSVTSPAAKTAEVHETYLLTPAPSGGMASPSATAGMAAGSPAASGAMNTGGDMMGMRPIPRLDIPANGSVELKPGSYHIMLVGLTKDLVAGDKIQLTLTFEKAGPITVTADVRAN